jgi:hypothetical protein
VAAVWRWAISKQLPLNEAETLLTRDQRTMTGSPSQYRDYGDRCVPARLSNE